MTFLDHIATDCLASFASLAQTPSASFTLASTGATAVVRDLSPAAWAKEWHSSILRAVRSATHEQEAQYRAQMEALPCLPLPIGFTPPPPLPRVSTSTKPTRRDTPEHSVPSTSVRLCLPNLIQHYGVGIETCTDPSCSNLHYRAIRGMPLQRAERAVTESALPTPVRQALLASMKGDPAKFPERAKTPVVSRTHTQPPIRSSQPKQGKTTSTPSAPTK